MSTPSHAGLRYLVEYDKRNSRLLSLSNAPTVGDAVSKAQDTGNKSVPVAVPVPNDDNDDNYAMLDFKRVPYLERRQVEHSSRGGPKSWIYRHGWGVWHQKHKKNH
ncbi:hypothetical protein CC86DRAFT_309307 [Ophiobolus disseminans]|uniref:Uncharacterized protein n=1 Tax=Ophiobolus disseminans TaxID=1469910 RepID=A0A6A6ZC31_9PLEO|nr:hypothetical protein CC86DRAFT_309307 [Ophiobolus disseminans]